MTVSTNQISKPIRYPNQSDFPTNQIFQPIRRSSEILSLAAPTLTLFSFTMQTPDSDKMNGDGSEESLEQAHLTTASNNLCGTCKVDMGEQNSRQLCGKWRCVNEEEAPVPDTCTQMSQELPATLHGTQELCTEELSDADTELPETQELPGTQELFPCTEELSDADTELPATQELPSDLDERSDTDTETGPSADTDEEKLFEPETQELLATQEVSFLDTEELPVRSGTSKTTRADADIEPSHKRTKSVWN